MSWGRAIIHSRQRPVLITPLAQCPFPSKTNPFRQRANECYSVPVDLRSTGRFLFGKLEGPPPSSFQARAQRPMTVCDGLPELNLWKRPLMKTAFVFGSTCNCSRNFLSWWRTRRGAMVRSRVSALRHLFHCESLARRCDSISQRETLNATLKSHPQHTLVGVYSFWCYPLGKWKKFPSNLLTASYPRYKRYGRNMKKSER